MNNKINITMSDGSIKEYDIILEFYKNKKRYAVYTDYTTDENGRLNCFPSILDDGKIVPIDDYNELDTISRMLETVQSSIKKDM